MDDRITESIRSVGPPPIPQWAELVMLLVAFGAWIWLEVSSPVDYRTKLVRIGLPVTTFSYLASRVGPLTGFLVAALLRWRIG